MSNRTNEANAIQMKLGLTKGMKVNVTGREELVEIESVRWDSSYDTYQVKFEGQPEIVIQHVLDFIERGIITL